MDLACPDAHVGTWLAHQLRAAVSGASERTPRGPAQLKPLAGLHCTADGCMALIDIARTCGTKLTPNACGPAWRNVPAVDFMF